VGNETRFVDFGEHSEATRNLFAIVFSPLTVTFGFRCKAVTRIEQSQSES
jgi:hypothetical protein